MVGPEHLISMYCISVCMSIASLCMLSLARLCHTVETQPVVDVGSSVQVSCCSVRKPPGDQQILPLENHLPVSLITICVQFQVKRYTGLTVWGGLRHITCLSVWLPITILISPVSLCSISHKERKNKRCDFSIRHSMDFPCPAANTNTGPSVLIEKCALLKICAGYFCQLPPLHQ